MSEPALRPPRLARVLVSLATPRRYRDLVLGDLEEGYQDRAEDAGVQEARRWYWSHAFGSVMPGVRARVRGRRAPPAGGPSRRADERREPRRMLGQEWGMEMWWRHARIALRSLARKPAFSLLAVGTLGLGIGANTAIFSVVHGSLLRELPYAEPDRVVYLSDGHENFGGAGIDVSIVNMLDIRAASELMSASAIFQSTSANLSADDRPQRARVLRTSSELLTVLGIPPRLGRDFTPDDDVAGAPRVAILSDGLWRRSFGADPGVVGRNVLVDSEPVLVVGVLPPDFHFPGVPELLMPIQHIGAEYFRGNRSYNAVARLAPGATVESLRAEHQSIFDGLRAEYPEANAGWYAWVDPIEEYVIGSSRDTLYLLGGAVVLVLLIACVNVANLLLVRAEGRRQELAVRTALGAGRAALVPYFLSEGLLIAAAGGALGILAASRGLQLLLAAYGDSLARGEQIALSGPVLLFGLGLTAAVGVAVGLVPLLRSRSVDLHEALRFGARGGTTAASKLGRTLVVAEVALAIVIVSGAGLLVNSMWRIQEVDLGVEDIDHVLTFRLALPESRYENGEPVVGFFDRLEEAVQRLPGVEAVGFVNRLPLLGGWNTLVTRWDDPEIQENFVSYRPVTRGYFDALGVSLVEGRWFDEADFADSVPKVLINETLAARLFPAGDAVGQRIGPWIDEGMLVVGIVEDVRGAGPVRPAPPAFYLPYSAFGGDRSAGGLVRTAGDPAPLVPLIRQAVEELDSEVPVFSVQTLEEIALSRTGSRRIATSIFGVFAGLALLLGAVGIYGVMSYAVAQQSREMGLRLALGASRMAVMRMVLEQGARLIGPGIVIGLVLALALGRFLDSLLFEVSALDPATYATVAGVLAAVGAMAVVLPARRATRVDPLTSMREA